MNATRIVVLIAALAGIVSTTRLGVWQLDRAAQKRQLQEQRDGRRDLPALSAADLAAPAAEPDRQLGRRVVVQGRWRADATVYLDNRPLGGVAGFAVITPLVLADGSVVVVQRGWLPRDAGDRTRIAPYVTSDGLVEVRGRMASPPSQLYTLGADAKGPIRQNIDLEAYGREIGRPVHSLTVVQEDAAAATNDGLRRDWPPPASDIQKNYGYAFQWFALSALISALYVWFQIIRPRRAGPA